MNNREKECEGWFIVGNEEYAFAINQFAAQGADIQSFDRDPEVNNDAFTRACGWAYLNPPDEIADDYNFDHCSSSDLP